jgi:hypothetical protein
MTSTSEQPTRLRRVLNSHYTQAVALYLLVRLVGIVALALAAAWHDEGLLDRLVSWDGQWYLKLAQYGYDFPVAPPDPDGKPFPEAPLAFFPLYPAFTSMVATLPGVSLEAGALLVSALAGAVAAGGILRLAQLVDPRPRVGLLLVTLWAGAPMAITLSMAYTEALFIACAVWSLVFVLERQWVAAGSVALLAGFVRSTASVLIAVVVVAALVAVCMVAIAGRRWRARRSRRSGCWATGGS